MDSALDALDVGEAPPSQQRPLEEAPRICRWQQQGLLGSGDGSRSGETEDFCGYRRRCAKVTIGRRLNGFLGLSLNDRTILFLVNLLDEKVSVR